MVLILVISAPPHHIQGAQKVFFSIFLNILIIWHLILMGFLLMNFLWKIILNRPLPYVSIYYRFGVMRGTKMATLEIMSPPTLVGRHIVLGLSVCPSQSLSAQFLWNYSSDFYKTWYIARASYVVVHITMKFWSPHFFRSCAPFN